MLIYLTHHFQCLSSYPAGVAFAALYTSNYTIVSQKKCTKSGVNICNVIYYHCTAWKKLKGGVSFKFCVYSINTFNQTVLVISKRGQIFGSKKEPWQIRSFRFRFLLENYVYFCLSLSDMGRDLESTLRHKRRRGWQQSLSRKLTKLDTDQSPKWIFFFFFAHIFVFPCTILFYDHTEHTFVRLSGNCLLLSNKVTVVLLTATDRYRISLTIKMFRRLAMAFSLYFLESYFVCWDCIVVNLSYYSAFQYDQSFNCILAVLHRKFFIFYLNFILPVIHNILMRTHAWH